MQFMAMRPKKWPIKAWERLGKKKSRPVKGFDIVRAGSVPDIYTQQCCAADIGKRIQGYAHVSDKKHSQIVS
jgi:hypothetical protein